MRKTILTIGSLLSVLFFNESRAQLIRCATVEYNKHLDSLNPSRRSGDIFEKWINGKIRERRMSILSAARTQSVYVIPVVVQIINNGEPIGSGTNISDAQVLSQIDVLNEDYRRLNSDTVYTPPEFQPVASDPMIQFRLALRDPQGNPTSGIVRVKGAKASWNYSSDDQLLKSQSFWPSDQYLNIWVCDLGTVLGYSQYPVSDLPGTLPPYDSITDGVVINYISFGSNGKGSFPSLKQDYALGRTATHEIGHYLSLRHIWGDEPECAQDDYCNDTPLQADATYDCTHDMRPYSCGDENMFQNYMDYSNDQCMNIFTQDQRERMRIVLENSPRRKSLLTSPALLPPNALPNDIAITGIIRPANISCLMDPVPALGVRNLGSNVIHSVTVVSSLDHGTDQSERITADITPGEYSELSLSPLNLTVGQHAISYNISQVNDSSDTDPADNSAGKNFLADDHRDYIPLRNDFRGGSIESGGWSVYNPDNGITWEIAGTHIDFKPDYSAVIRFYDYTDVNQMDWLISPVLDFSGSPAARMTFSYSYASRSGNNDFLQVKVSADCGESFPYTVFQASGIQLTAKSSSQSWIPTSSSDWQDNLVNLDQFAGSKNIRVAFLGQNGNGNNLYIDNIEFYLTGYSSNFSRDPNSVYIFPNPVQGSDFFVSIKTDTRQPVDLFVTDAMGRIVYRDQLEDVLNQTYEVKMDAKASGLYIVSVRGNNFTYSKKVAIAR